ncbi:hypothetical protein H9P43_006997 [Blastocladiella emersonii ATCC 22665]|nr:hypothetical protein H9P43_006997 [Blastocladiella emersonii ATCC 22665]
MAGAAATNESDSGLSPAAIEAVGYAGGIVLAFCLVPQIKQVVVTKSAEDISYSWTVLYLIGLAVTLAYMVLVGAVAGYVSVALEIALLLVLMALKYHYDRLKRQQRAALGHAGDGGHGDKREEVGLVGA